MKTLRWMSRTAVAALLLCLAAGVVEAQVDQGELAEQLRHGDRAAQFEATQRVLDLGPERASPAVREALITAMTDEAESHAAWRRGEVPRGQYPEMIARMAWVVARWEDPRAIEPLAEALGTGAGATRGLARLGEPAVQAAVEAARTAEGLGSTARVTDALLALRFLAEGVGRTPLSGSSREEMIEVARERLAPAQAHGSILRRAIDLAVALDDPGLREIVEAMAGDPVEVETRVVQVRPQDIERTQRVAVDRLRGVPPLPRWSQRW